MVFYYSRNDGEQELETLCPLLKKTHTMNIDSQEFRKFAVKHQGIGGLHVDKFIAQANLNPKSMTPYIIEERQLNVA